MLSRNLTSPWASTLSNHDFAIYHIPKKLLKSDFDTISPKSDVGNKKTAMPDPINGTGQTHHEKSVQDERDAHRGSPSGHINISNISQRKIEESGDRKQVKSTTESTKKEEATRWHAKGSHCNLTKEGNGLEWRITRRHERKEEIMTSA